MYERKTTTQNEKEYAILTMGYDVKLYIQKYIKLYAKLLKKHCYCDII